jgi:hypothetical protein
MKLGAEFCETVRVLMHLNGGFTRVLLEDPLDLAERIASGALLAEAGRYWDLPTEGIPAHLRAIGSRFIVHHTAARPDPSDSADAIRVAVRDFVVEELHAERGS